MRPRICAQTADGISKGRLRRAHRREGERGIRRHVVDDLQHGAAFIDIRRIGWIALAQDEDWRCAMRRIAHAGEVIVMHVRGGVRFNEIEAIRHHPHRDARSGDVASHDQIRFHRDDSLARYLTHMMPWAVNERDGAHARQPGRRGRLFDGKLHADHAMPRGKTSARGFSREDRRSKVDQGRAHIGVRRRAVEIDIRNHAPCSIHLNVRVHGLHSRWRGLSLESRPLPRCELAQSAAQICRNAGQVVRGEKC